MGEEGQTVGERVYLIREALGTRRDPMPLDRFAELIRDRTGFIYDKSTLSRMETGERKVSLEDVEVLAVVDPLERGRAWLAFGDQGESDQGAIIRTNDTPRVGPAVHKTVEKTNLGPVTERRKGKPVTKKPGRSALAS